MSMPDDDGFLDALVAEMDGKQPLAQVVPLAGQLPPPAGKRTRSKPGSSWASVDLAAVLSGEYAPPQPEIGLVEGSTVPLFYPGELHSVFGDSGAGKSWFLAWVTSQVLAVGRDVVFVDYEATPAALISRLRKVGVPDEQILAHVIYISPKERWDGHGARHLYEALADRDVALAVIDSTGESMAMDGINPNDDAEVTRWMHEGAPEALVQTGAAVVGIDHVVKSRESGRNTEFASGSHRKRDAITAAYYLEAVVAPSRERDGLLKLTTRKDRHGWRTHGDVAAEIKMVNGPGDTVHISAVQPAARTEEDWVGIFAGRVCAALLAAGAPMSRAAIKKEVGGRGTTVDAAIERLLARGNATQEIGYRGAKLVSLVRHVDDDPQPGDDTTPF